VKGGCIYVSPRYQQHTSRVEQEYIPLMHLYGSEWTSTVPARQAANRPKRHEGGGTCTRISIALDLSSDKSCITVEVRKCDIGKQKGVKVGSRPRWCWLVLACLPKTFSAISLRPTSGTFEPHLTLHHTLCSHKPAESALPSLQKTHHKPEIAFTGGAPFPRMFLLHAQGRVKLVVLH
jgi:hypothetical protein